MTQVRMPVSVSASMALHVGGLLLFMHVSQLENKHKTIDISNVDIIRVLKPVPVPHAAKPKAEPPTLKDFLKMALPAVHKSALLAMDTKLPEIRRPLMPAPKLDDRGHLQTPLKMDRLDLNKRRVDMQGIGAAPLIDHHTAALASLPRLEDVGRRQVRNLPQAIKLEEERQQAVALKSFGASSPVVSHHQVAPAAALQDAQPSGASSRLERAMSQFLPAAQEPVRLQQQAAEPRMAKRIDAAPPPLAKRSAAAQAVKKGVELEGPLKDRMVASYDIPEFPDWAKKQGILDADVVILFWVDSEGNVLSDMQVAQFSGYPRLDRLVMDSLRNWKFVPISSGQKQWGRITFHFVLE